MWKAPFEKFTIEKLGFGEYRIFLTDKSFGRLSSKKAAQENERMRQWIESAVRDKLDWERTNE